MREIKFRAWVGYRWVTCFDYCHDPKDLRQYIGIIDKNGTAVYEGDIVTYFRKVSKKELKPVVEIIRLYNGRFIDRYEEIIDLEVIATKLEDLYEE